jgi:serine protease Do
VVGWWVLLAACGRTGGEAGAPAPLVGLPAPVEVAGSPAVQVGGVPAATLPDVAERVTRSVVAITVERPLVPPDRPPDGFFDVPQHRRPLDGVGSGVIARSDGVVLTNHHVIAEASSVRVTLHDGRVLGATVVGGDRATDVAVLRLEAPPPDLLAIDLGRSGTLRLGEVVLAVGNPFGVGQTVTMGIVSALGRTGLGLTEYEDFIQTDAAISPGNSGGALVDLHGRLVGLVAAIRSESGGSEGIAFAIPVDRARAVAEALLEKGRVERGFLGISMRPATPGAAATLGPPGVVVTDVLPASPAADAGFRTGDVIVELDGEPVRDVQRLRYDVASAGPGHAFAATVVRDGERLALAGTLGLAPGAPATGVEEPPLGVAVRAIGPDERVRFGLPPSLVSGLVVESVSTGPLATAGLLPGDVILDVDHARVDDAAGLVARVRQARGGHLLLRVWRAGDVRFVAVAVE